MSAIKDKPLKKIICDKRITLDVIHNDKIKDIDRRWKTMSDSERSNTVIQMVSMRRKLADAYHTERPKPSGGMYQKRAGD